MEQRFGQPEARLYSWRGFAYKTNTIALLTCFSSSVLGETGLGAIWMCFFALGPSWNSVWRDFKQGSKLFEWSVFVVGPAWNRGWGYSNDLCLSLVRRETGVGAISMSLFVYGPAWNRGWGYWDALCLPLVRRETGVGPIRRLFERSVFVIGPQWNRGGRDFNVSFCVWSGVKQGLELFEGIVFVVFVVGPAWNRCWSYPWERSLSSVLGETGFGLSSAVLGKSKEYQSEGGRLLEPSRNQKKNTEQRHRESLFQSIYGTKFD